MANDWTIAPARTALPAFAAAWDALDRTLHPGAPAFDSRVLLAGLEAEGTGRELLCTRGGDGQAAAALILRPAGWGRWALFLPRQATAGAVLCRDASLLETLFAHLPGRAWAIELLSIDPEFGPSWEKLALPRKIARPALPMSPGGEKRRAVYDHTLFRSEVAAGLSGVVAAWRRTARRPGPDAPALERYGQVAELPADAIALLENESRINVESHPLWFANLQEHVFNQDIDGVRYYVGRSAGQAVTVWPLRLVKGFPVRQIHALANYYTSSYRPVLSGTAGVAGLTEAIRGASQELRGAQVARLFPLETRDGTFEATRTALRSAGWIPLPYFCFGNWTVAIRSDWAAYLAQRDGRHRSTIKGKSKSFLAAEGTLEVHARPEGLADAIAAYETVYAQSWKKPEPYTGFVPGLLARLAGQGMLRLGIARLAGKPVAAQIWIVHSGRASIYKVAYDEAYANFAVGTVLTAHLMQHVIDVDKVVEVDFLIGDDPYKKKWMESRGERMGIIAFNAATPLGLLMLARELAGRLARRVLTRINRKTGQGAQAG